MNDLPFIKEPEFDYILTDDDRKKFAPLQVTDEVWTYGQWMLTCNNARVGFAKSVHYRRRKSTLPQPPKTAAELAFMAWVEDQPLMGWDAARNGWLAAVAWAKDHKEAL